VTNGGSLHKQRKLFDINNINSPRFTEILLKNILGCDIINERNGEPNP
jgi:hypothetical protein